MRIIAIATAILFALAAFMVYQVFQGPGEAPLEQPTEVAEEAPPPTIERPAGEEKELTDSASSYPLLALIGMLLMAGAVLLRVYRRGSS